MSNCCCPPVIFGNAGGETPEPCISPDSETVLTVDGDGCLGLTTDPGGPVRPGPNGLTVCVSPQEDNALTQDADGCLYVPADEPQPVVTGCGILGDGTDQAPLTAGTSGTWGAGQLAFPCDDTNGGSIYCDSQGQLRTAPPPIARGFSEFAQESVSGPPEAVGTTRTTHDVTLTITNPSTCRTMITSTRVSVNGVAFTQTAGNDWSVDWGLSFSTDGSEPPPPVVGSGLLRRRTAPDLASPDEWEFPVIDALTSAGGFGYLGPGETIQVRAAVGITFHAVNPAAGADGTAPAWRIREFGLYAWGFAI